MCGSIDRTVKSFCNLHCCKWTTSRHSVHACIAQKQGSKTVEREFPKNALTHQHHQQVADSHRNALSKALLSTSLEDPASFKDCCKRKQLEDETFSIKSFSLQKSFISRNAVCPVNIYEAFSLFSFPLCCFWKWSPSHKVPGPESELPASGSKVKNVLILQCSSFL